MRLAVSNIAWPAEDEAAIADLLARQRVDGVEIAPTKVWPQPLDATDTEIRNYRHFWEKRGISIIAMQALLFARPDLRMFQDASQRQAALDYLFGIIRLAAKLDVQALVFGSPRNRVIAPRSPAEILPVAVEFFRRLAEAARQHRTTFCIEPNPTCYGCDFITTAREGIELVQQVNDPGFALHLDAAALMLCGDPLEATFASSLPWWRHFHVSEPQLAPIGQGSTDHASIAGALRASGYHGWLSLEMKPGSNGCHEQNVERALLFTRQVYLGEESKARLRSIA